MKPDEIRKLLGGYATGTLSDEERNLLYSAALKDQELFDAMADEEALRELLAEPHTRQALIDELQQQPVPNASLLPDQRIPSEFAARAMSLPNPPVRAELQSLMERFWRPRRLAIAGGLAMVLLISGGIQYKRLHAPGRAPVNLAMNRATERDPSPATKPDAQRSIAPSPTQPAQVSSKQTGLPPVDPGVAAVRRAKERPAQANEPSPLNQRIDENRAAVPSAVAREAAASEKNEKETSNEGPAREQLNQAIREQASQARRAEGASQTPTERQTETTVKSRERTGSVGIAPVTPSQIVTGGLRRAASPAPSAPPSPAAVPLARQIDAKVTDINGTIVSINAGSNIGLQAGDTIEIVRDNRVIATSKLSQVGATFAVGPVLRTVGSADKPRAGDAVRRATTPPPQR